MKFGEFFKNKYDFEGYFIFLKIILIVFEETQNIIEKRRKEYNTIRPHSSLGHRPLAQFDRTILDRDLVTYPGCAGKKVSP